MVFWKVHVPAICVSNSYFFVVRRMVLKLHCSWTPASTTVITKVQKWRVANLRFLHYHHHHHLLFSSFPSSLWLSSSIAVLIAYTTLFLLWTNCACQAKHHTQCKNNRSTGLNAKHLLKVWPLDCIFWPKILWVSAGCTTCAIHISLVNGCNSTVRIVAIVAEGTTDADLIPQSLNFKLIVPYWLILYMSSEDKWK